MTLTEKPLPLNRHLYSLEEFNKYYPDKHEEKVPFSKKCASQLYCSRQRLWKGVTTVLPVTEFLRKYKWKKWIAKDILAGVTAGIMHIPQGLSYGYLAALQPVYGLYTAFFSTIFYVLFGTSQYLSFGVDAVTSILAGGIIQMELENLPLSVQFSQNLTENGTSLLSEDGVGLEHKAAIATAASLTVGLILMLMSFLRLGFITLYLSDSFISGFTTGAAVHIATSQIPKMLGIKVGFVDGVGKVVRTYIILIQKLGSTNVAELIVSLVCVAVLFIVKTFVNERYASKLKIPLPIDLIVVILGTVASHFGEFHDNYDVNIVKEIPAGLPAPTMPGLDKITPVTFFIECFIIAVLVFAVSISMAKLCAKKHGTEVDDNQELMAYGMSNALSSFFHCFPSCCGSPRTMLLSTMGSKSTLSGVSAAALILLVLMVIGKLFYALPVCVLAAMIVVAMKKLFLQVKDLKLYWQVNVFDFVIWIATFLSVVLLDIDIGLGVGVVVSAFTVLFQTQTVGGLALGKSNSEDVAASMKKDNIHPIPGVRVFKFQTAFYFANAEILRKSLYKCTVNPKVLAKEMAKAMKKNRDPKAQVSKLSQPKKSTLTNSQAQPHGLSYTVQTDDRTGYLDVGKVNGGYLDMEHVNNGYPDIEPMGNCLSTLENGVPELGGDHIVFQRDIDRIRHIVLDCSAVSYIDIAGIKMMKQIIEDFKSAKITVLLAGCSSKMIKALEAAGFFETVEKSVCFYEVTDAIQTAIIDRCEAVQSTVTKL